MRCLLAIACIAGCSFTPGRLGDALVADDAPADDANVADDVPVDAVPAPFSLDGEQWLLPCTPGSNGTPNSRACLCANGVMHQSQIAGGVGQTWRVTIHIRGVMERLSYVGGTAVGAWYVGGSQGADGGNNIYRIAISSPASHYYLNHGSASQNYSTVHDYIATFDIDGGATVTFEASGQDGIQWEGVDMNDQPISLPGVVDPPQPYNGQFAILDVVSADPI